MRRNSNKKTIIFSAIVIVAVAIFCATVMKKGSPQTFTVTDANGITYLAIYDQNSSAYAGITDKDGSLFAARIDENGELLLDDSMFAVNNYTGTLPTNNTTVIDIQQTNGTDYDYIGQEVSRVDQTESTTAGTTQQNPDQTQQTTENTTQNQEQPLLMEKYDTLFRSGTYYMSFTTSDPDMPGEIVTAFKNGNFYVETTVEGMKCKVVYKASSKTGFMVIPDMRMYCTLPDDMLDELSAGTLTMDNEDEYSSVERFTAMLGDRQCQCEEYKYDDGTVRTYYFYGDQLVRFDDVPPEGSATIYNINVISSTVDDSLFDTPKGYIKINLGMLSGLAR